MTREAFMHEIQQLASEWNRNVITTDTATRRVLDAVAELEAEEDDGPQ